MFSTLKFSPSLSKKKKKNQFLKNDVIIIMCSCCFAVADRPRTGRRADDVRARSDAGQLRVRVAAAVRAVPVDGAGPRHCARHEAVPLHVRHVPGAGEPVRRGRGRAGHRRVRAGQPHAPAPDPAPVQRDQAGQRHGDGRRAPAPRAVRPRRRGRDRNRRAGHGVRQPGRQRPSGRRRIHRRQFNGKYYNTQGWPTYVISPSSVFKKIT